MCQAVLSAPRFQTITFSTAGIGRVRRGGGRDGGGREGRERERHGERERERHGARERERERVREKIPPGRKTNPAERCHASVHVPPSAQCRRRQQQGTQRHHGSSACCTPRGCSCLQPMPLSQSGPWVRCRFGSSCTTGSYQLDLLHIPGLGPISTTETACKIEGCVHPKHASIGHKAAM